MFKLKNTFFIFFVCFCFFTIKTNVMATPYVNFKITYDNKTYNYNNERVYLHINSKPVENLPLEPIILNDYTLVPARESFEKIGATVTWIKSNEQIQIVYKDIVVLMKINDKNATVNGSLFKMDIPPKLINSKTMIPVRFVSQAIGLNVSWDNKTRVINISEPKEETTEATSQAVQQSVTNAPIITLNKITAPSSNERTFAIYANNKIEKFEQVILENGAVAIDIYNSINNIEDKNINSNLDFISNVTIENKENNITRFIFNIKNSVLTNNILSPDGKILYINFGGNPIKKIELFNNGYDDVLKIYGDLAPNITINKNDKENILDINIRDAVILDLIEDIKPTKYINNIDYTQINNSTINIKAKINEDIKFSYVSKDNFTTIVIAKEQATIDKDKTNNTNTNANNVNNNITSKNQFKISKNANIPVNLNNIKHTDNYLDKEYILTFDTDITPLIPQGEYAVNNELVDKILVENIGHITQIILNSKKIIAVNVTEDKDYIYINMLLPKEKYKSIVVIDPGHGGSAPGTSGNGLVEKDVNLDIALMLNDLFNNQTEIKAYFTRLDDTNPSFNDRTNMSNEVGDMFISIHQNSTDKNNPSPNGTEVFYLNPNTNDRGITSKYMAEVLQKNLLKDLGTFDRKIKTSNLIVLRNNKMPAVLCEIAFLSNPSDAKKLGTPEFRQKTAKSIFDSVVEIFKAYPSKR